MQTGDLAHPATALGVLHREDLGVGPVEVVSDKGYLLVDRVEGVA